MPNTPVRHTHRMAIGLEDAIAIALDILFESDKPKHKDPLTYINQRANRLIKLLQILRIGPNSYDPDRQPQIVLRRKSPD